MLVYKEFQVLKLVFEIILKIWKIIDKIRLILI